MFRIGFVAMLLWFGWTSVSKADETRIKSLREKRDAVEKKLTVLQQAVRPGHPAVPVLRKELNALDTLLAKQAEQKKNTLLVVLTKSGVGATLKNVRVKALGKRSFIGGLSVADGKITKGTFVGKVIWFPVDEITQMIELPMKKVKEKKQD